MDDLNPARMTRLALLFEAGLGAAALVIGWLVGQWPLVNVGPSGPPLADQVAAAGWGLVATGPLLVALVLIDRFPVGPLRQLRNLTASVIVRMFGGATILQLAMVSIAAALGEEVLFRGLVQAGLEQRLTGPYGPGMALAFASVLFGVCHWLNTTYAILAVLAGAYFGWLLQATGSLWAPVVAHASYDFVALVYLVRSNRLVGSVE